MLAEGYGEIGQPEKGLDLLAEALDIAKRIEERFYEAELYRLKGQLVLQSGVRSPKSEPTSTQHLAPKRRRRDTF